VSQHRTLGELIYITSALLCMSLASPVLAEDLELTKEELISWHIDSIGSKEELAGVRFRVAQGTCIGRGRVFSLVGDDTGSLPGDAEFVTGPNATQFILKFNSAHYPIEGFLFDGKEIRLAVFEPPRHSGLTEADYRLGQFTDYASLWEEYIKRGLFGGVLNALWPLLSPEKNSGKMKSLKRTKIDGKELLVLRYHVRGTQGAELFFEPGTFHHVATRIRSVAGQSLAVGMSHSNFWTNLWEEFSDFIEVDGIHLPTRWAIRLELPQDTSSWEITFDRVKHTEGPELNRSAR